MGDSGRGIEELCRSHGISNTTYSSRKSRYGGLGASELKRIEVLEAEKSKLKRMYADLVMENKALRELIGKEL